MTVPYELHILVKHTKIHHVCDNHRYIRHPPMPTRYHNIPIELEGLEQSAQYILGRVVLFAIHASAHVPGWRHLDGRASDCMLLRASQRLRRRHVPLRAHLPRRPSWRTAGSPSHVIASAYSSNYPRNRNYAPECQKMSMYMFKTLSVGDADDAILDTASPKAHDMNR